MLNFGGVQDAISYDWNYPKQVPPTKSRLFLEVESRHGILWIFFRFHVSKGMKNHRIHLADLLVLQGLTYTRLLRGFRMVRVLLEASDGLEIDSSWASKIVGP